MNYRISGKFLKRIVLLFTVIISLSMKAQAPIDTTYQLPYKEALHYRVYYKLGGIWVYAAFANFKTDTVTFQNKKCYNLTVDAFTRKKYNWIYSLEDHYTSITDINTFKPLKFKEYNIEKGVTYNNVYDFDWDKGEINILMSRSGKNNDTVRTTKKLPGFITDSYSAVHYIRLWDFDQINIGDTLRYKTILDGKIFDQEIVYHGKDFVKDSDGNKVEAFKLEALVRNSSFFRADKGIIVWVANNKDRWIIVVDAKIIVGSIYVFLDQPGVASFNRH